MAESGWIINSLGDNSNISLSLNNGYLVVTEVNSGTVENDGKSNPVETTASIKNTRGFTVKKGTTYKLSVKLISSMNRTLSFFLVDTENSWPYVANAEQVDAKQGEQLLTTTFTTTETTEVYAYLAFGTNWDNTFNNCTVQIAEVLVDEVSK